MTREQHPPATSRRPGKVSDGGDDTLGAAAAHDAAVSSLPQPLTSPDVNLRGLPWMRLDTSRLLDSDLFALSTGDEFKAAVSLWCKSWTQEPAASLPTDDRVLAHLSSAGAKWKRVRAMALRGWVLCDDGRLYHPVVAEQAMRAWEERVEYRERLEGQNARQNRLREERAALMADLKANGVQLAWNTPIAEVRSRHAELPKDGADRNDQSRTCHGDSHGLDGRGTGRDGNKELLPNNPRADSSIQGASAHALALRGIGYSDCSPNHPDLVAAKAEGITPDELVDAARSAPGKGIPYVVARARGRRTDAAARQQEQGSTSAPAPAADPETVARVAAERDLDDRIRKIRNDCELHLIDQAERDRRIGEARDRAREMAAGAVS